MKYLVKGAVISVTEGKIRVRSIPVETKTIDGKEKL